PYIVALYMLFNRYRQRYGGYLVHLGLVMLVLGVIGSHYFQQQRDAVLKPGQEATIAGYRLTYLGNIDTREPDKETITAQLQIWSNGQLQTYIYPGRITYHNYGDQPASLIPINTFGLTDLYVVLTDWTGAAQATIRVFVNPLVSLVWYGGVLMLLGGIVCWWPEHRRSLAVAGGATKKNVEAEKPAGVVNGGVVV
ncbi:MAG: heme lyase CcmF/NrfE family subunit, partial [Ktedonobacteraceae bacterium]|nr:heme lyase CcmF/NrfE family subunit [Ktedonobacteraceae bacterium]